jgi:SAM-dependent methyltransferase
MRNTRAVAEINLEEVETNVGPLLVPADDAVVAPVLRARGAWAEGLGARLTSLLQPGMTVVDVGANVGYLALLMAERVGPSGRVVAIEPDPINVQVLRLNAGRTRGAPIDIVEVTDLWKREPLNLDEVLPARVDLLSIDTHAAPHVSLYGARGLLERSRPLLLMAFWPQRLRETGIDPVSALDGFRALGLRPVAAQGDQPADPGELVDAVDAGEAPFTTLQLEWVDPAPPARERLLPASRRLGCTWERRFPSPTPRTLAYDATHRALIASLLDSEKWRAIFASGGQLPPGLGAGFDERVVEYPWLFSRGLSGRVLDAGSVLNHRHVVERLLPAIDDLTIVTLAPEPVAFTSLGISYLYADLRNLPLRDDWFDEIVCLSTLEHVGMDNAGYGAAGPQAEDPREDAAQALRELLRVVRPGGRIHLSVPFGRREDLGWLRQLDRDDVDDLLKRAGAGRHEEVVFGHTHRGWRRIKPEPAEEMAYNPGPGRAEDGAVAARAVWCATIHA